MTAPRNISTREDDLPLTKEQMEDHRLEIENRIRNLFWTVSGDYSMEISPDVEAYAVSPTLALYNAIKQGAFAKHFDTEALALYTLKKRASGADESLLLELAQLCVDAAAYPHVSQERSGIHDIREGAFRLLLDDSPLGSLSLLGQMCQCLVRRFLGEPDSTTGPALEAALDIENLADAANTDDVIATIDQLYNSYVDLGFEDRGGDLESILSMTTEELIQATRWQEISDKKLQRVMDEYLKILKEEILKMKPTATSAAHRKAALTLYEDEDDVPEPDPVEAEKIYAYMERQFGKSFLSKLDQERVNRRLCTGIHKRSSLYFTEGILSNPAMKNTQFLRTQMQNKKNEMFFNMKKNTVRRLVAELSAMLKLVQVMRMDEDCVRAEYGDIAPARLWKATRTDDTKLFDARKRREGASFAIDLLLDSSGSQTQRQPEVALQGYVISQALSEAGIPCRVSAFCSYWDYTMIHRFRDFDEPASANKNILQFRAFGENRDGLVIRAACDSLAKRPEEHKILIILSDGKPNHLGSTRPGTRKPVAYLGDEAIRDTALEIRKARNSGIQVMGIFVGREEDLYAERKIFGKEFAYTRNIGSFAHIVGTYLRKQMELD